MTPKILDGTYVELWNVKAWRRKLGIGDEAPTLAQRIEVLVVGGSVANANARLAAFSTLEETGYVVQTALSPPTFAGREIIGTPNQVDVANGDGIAGNTTLSLPQDIHTGASPEFQTIRPSLLTPEFVTYVNAVGELDSTGVTADALNTIGLGTPGYFPYWLGGAGGLASTSTIFTDGTFTGVGVDVLGTPITPDTPLHVWVQDFNHSAVTDLLKLDHYDPVGMAAGGGTGMLFVGSSDTAHNRDMGRIQTRWTTATDATRASAMDFQTAVAGGTLTTYVTILGDGNVGIGTNNPSANRLHVHTESAVTNTVIDALRLNRGVTGGFGTNPIGVGIMFAAKTTTTDNTDMARIVSQWSTGAHATRTSRIDFYVCNLGSIPTQVMRLTGEGRLGIGETAPGTLLHIKGATANMTFESTGATEPDFIFRPNGSEGGRFRGIVGGGMRFTGVGGGGEIMRLTLAGSVLIGRTTGTDRLDVSIDDAVTNAVTNVATYHHSSTGTPTAGFGTGIRIQGESSSNVSRDMARFGAVWTTSTDATRTSAIEWQTVSIAAALATRMALSGAGGLSVGDASNTMPVGVINAVTGFRVNNVATLGQVLMGDGTNIVLQAMPAATHTILDAAVHTDSVTQTVTRGSLIYGNATPKWDELAIGATAQYLRSGATDIAWSFLQASEITGTLAIGNGGTNNTTFTTNAVIFYNGTSLTDDGAAFTYQASGDNQLLIAKTLGVTQSDIVGYYALNSSGAAAGAANQQWSPSFIWEGQGWGGSSQNVRFRSYVAPVEAATNPTGYWILERNINALGYVELLRADSTGYLRITKDALSSIDTTLAQSVFGLHLTNNTTSTGAITTQDAPPIIFKGQARNTTANTSHDWRWRMLMKGVTNTGTTRSYLRIDSGADASNFGNPVVMSSAGGLSVGALIEAAFGVVSAQVGFQIAGGATSGRFLVGNGTNFVETAVGTTTFPHSLLSATHTDTVAAVVTQGAIIIGNAIPAWSRLVIGPTARLLRSNGTDPSWAQAVLTTDVTGVLPVPNGGTNKNAWQAGSVAFAGPAGTALAETNSTFFWDYTLTRLGIGTAVPSVLLDLGLAGTTAGIMRLAGLTSGNVTIKTQAIAGTWTLELPQNDGNPGDVLSTNGGGITSWIAVSAGAAHDILSATHTDTLAAAVSQGSLIVGNATPLWAEFLIGAANTVLRTNGTDPAWAKLILSTDVTGLLALANGGTNKLMVASAGAVAYCDADSLELTAVGTSGQVLLSQATGAPIWSSGSPLLNLWFAGSGANWSPTAASIWEDVTFGSGTFELSLTAGTWLVIAVIDWEMNNTFSALFGLDVNKSGTPTAATVQQFTAGGSGHHQLVLHFRITVGSTQLVNVMGQTDDTTYTNLVAFAATSNISAVRLTA